MLPNRNRLYKLTYIQEAFGDDKEIVFDLATIFLDSTPKDLAELNLALEEKNYEKLAAVAHKMKSSLAILRVDDLKEIMISIDKPFKTNEKKDELPDIVRKINEVLTIVFQQMREDFSL